MITIIVLSLLCIFFLCLLGFVKLLVNTRWKMWDIAILINRVPYDVGHRCLICVCSFYGININILIFLLDMTVSNTIGFFKILFTFSHSKCVLRYKGCKDC